MRTCLLLSFLTAPSLGFAPFSFEPQVTASSIQYKDDAQRDDSPSAIPQTPNTQDIVSPVLHNVYPELQSYLKQYGHPNIPLGNSAGRNCATLRRLRIQGKLDESDIALLDDMGFTWHSLEDVYEKQKDQFDDLLKRLQEYGGDLSPPKKYQPDPELGAWVTALRRLYRVGEVDESHVEKLDALGFAWVSPRQCGSKFMIQYRATLERLETESKETVLGDPEVQKWIQAQQKQYHALSETRKQYMRELVGVKDWKSWSPSMIV